MTITKTEQRKRKRLMDLDKPTVSFPASDKLITMGDFVSHAGGDAEMQKIHQNS